MEDKTLTGSACSHDCHSCATDSCDTTKKKNSFFATLGAISDHTDKISDEELMQMLQEAVDEWDAD